MIIQALNRYQKNRGGYLTEKDMHAVADELQVPLYKVQELVTFFPHYRTTPPPCVEVHVCRDMACHLRGSVPAIEQLEAWAHDTYGDKVHVSGVSCLGRCDRAPAALVNEKLFVLKDVVQTAISQPDQLMPRWTDKLQRVIEEACESATSKAAQAAGDVKSPASPQADDMAMNALADDLELALPKRGSWQIDVYSGAASSYRAVKEYLDNPDPKRVVSVLEKAGLLGMGGAGGRTYLKWKEVYEAKSTNGEKYIVCNADESEPGTFKDRDLLLITPHLTIEGMILAALVVGATRGWVYIRHEYPEQALALQSEIDRAKKIGALGSNIFDSGRSFELEVFVSPGNYICGEQTALIEAMENKRAEPRIRPPELITNGYKDQPTLLNNVETFAWVPAIMLREKENWYAEQGRKTGPLVGESGRDMRGMRFFSVSGDVCRPGAYEVPTGITLGELIRDHCGGMLPGKELVAVALSGPSGGLLPAKIPFALLKKDFKEKYPAFAQSEALDVQDVPLDITVSRALGIMIGAGIVIYGTGCDLLAEAVSLSRFFRNESCGKCVPCRIGSQKITQMGIDILDGRVPASDVPVMKQTVKELADIMGATSICGLGQVAHQPMRSLFRYFPELVEQACQSGRRA